MENQLSFEKSLIKTAKLNEPKNLKVLVEYEVIRKCIDRGFISYEDKENKTCIYLWVKEIIDNDYKALSLLRKYILAESTLSNMKEINDEVDDMSEAITRDMAKKIINRQMELPF